MSLYKQRSVKHDRPWCFPTSAHRLNARGAVATGFLKRCVYTTPIVLQCILRLENESGPGMLQTRSLEQPFAFKDLMIHLILQFTLHIAFRGVLHRCGNQEIHRWKVSFSFLIVCKTSNEGWWFGWKVKISNKTQRRDDQRGFAYAVEMFYLCSD